jgi:hypothetical protein
MTGAFGTPESKKKAKLLSKGPQGKVFWLKCVWHNETYFKVDLKTVDYTEFRDLCNYLM